MNAVRQIELAVLILVGGSIASLLLSRWRRLCGWVSFAFMSLAAASLGLAVALAFTGESSESTLLAVPQLGARLELRVDPLSAVFLAIVAVVSWASTLYSVRYMDHYKKDGIAKFFPILLLCVASMVGVLVVTDFFFFLIFWELMTLTSYFLVTFESASAASQRAGLKYFIITHGATLCMVAAALLLWRTSGSFSFGSIRHTLATMLSARPILAHTIVFLFFLGFATKAGVLPMGDWLPDAHPVAPSGMSATLSGALVKIGIYGLIRLFCYFLVASSALKIWGIILALAGTGSLFVGNLTALRQNDSKRLMAFSTIGQIGYVCLGLGVGVYCMDQYPAPASIAIAGAILHVVNHACFKSCLFLGAGSVLYRTGQRDMNQLGGLASAMPYTTGSTAIASLSIAGVPPLNGFASKWLIIAGCLLAGMRYPLFLLLGIVALFISLVTLAAYLKMLGSIFLGQTKESESVQEVPAAMIVPQAVLAALCVLLGIVPQLGLRFISHAITALTGMQAIGVDSSHSWRGILLTDGSPVGFWSPLACVASLVILGLIAFGIERAGRSEVRSVPVWFGGEEHDSALVRYPASSFYVPFNSAFQGLYPARAVHAPKFPPPVRRALDLDRWLYVPAVNAIDRIADRVSRTQTGIPQIYLLWIVIGAAILTGLVLLLKG